MKAFAFLLIVVAFFAVQTEQKEREKRSIFDFGRLIRCQTGRNPLDYNNYGNWCGFGGSGQPVDATDRCCRKHDQCYDRLLSAGTCSSFGLRVRSYKTNGCSRCASSNSGCGAGLCYCDLEAAVCFKNALSTYDPRNKN